MTSDREPSTSSRALETSQTIVCSEELEVCRHCACRAAGSEHVLPQIAAGSSSSSSTNSRRSGGKRLMSRLAAAAAKVKGQVKDHVAGGRRVAPAAPQPAATERDEEMGLAPAGVGPLALGFAGKARGPLETSFVTAQAAQQPSSSSKGSSLGAVEVHQLEAVQVAPIRGPLATGATPVVAANLALAKLLSTASAVGAHAEAAQDAVEESMREAEGAAPCSCCKDEDGVVLEPSMLEAAKNPGLLHHVLLYHLFFSLAVVTNLVLIALAAWDILPLGRLNSGGVGLIVLSISVLMRSELLVGALYWIFCTLGRAAPPRLRFRIAQIPYNLPGGMHSGCAVAGVAWEVLYAFQFWLLPVKGPGLTSEPWALLCSITCILLLVLLGLILLLSIPAIRHRHHNTFELNHRYLGWSVVAISWLHVWAAAAYFARFNEQGKRLRHPTSAAAVLLDQADLWCVAVITLLVFHPWMFVRKRTVTATVPTSRKSCLILSGFPGHARAGIAGRIATRWWADWHSFAAVSGARDGSAEGRTHSMIIAPAGDWTKARIQEASELQGEKRQMQVYARLIRAPGFMYTTRMWDRIVIVASGAGIAPVLPCVQQRSAASTFVLWICNRPDSFGPVRQTLESCLGPDKLWIHDTSTMGRPDVVALTLKAVKREEAEAMYIVANLPLTYAVVRGCRAINLPAFGAIWDS